jgi:asparagine synthase (glutamine-hydrolysing)
MEHDALNYDTLQHYLTFQYVPEPMMMSVGIKKLEPGHYIKKKVGVHLYKKTGIPSLSNRTDRVMPVFPFASKHLKKSTLDAFLFHQSADR